MIAVEMLLIEAFYCKKCVYFFWLMIDKKLIASQCMIWGEKKEHGLFGPQNQLCVYCKAVTRQ